MSDLARALRAVGIAIAVMFAVGLLWVVLIGPSILILLHPR